MPCRARHFGGALDFRPILHLEGDVVQLRLRIIDEVHGMMIGVAAQEGEVVGMPVGDAEAEHVAIEFYGLVHVVDAIGDMAEFQRHDAGLPSVVLGEGVVGKEFDDSTFGVAEDNSIGDAGRNPAGALAFHAVPG